MTGTTVQLSHEPSLKRKGTGTRHTEKHQWRKKKQQQQEQSLGRGGGGGGRGRKWVEEPRGLKKKKKNSTRENWTRQ